MRYQFRPTVMFVSFDLPPNSPDVRGNIDFGMEDLARPQISRAVIKTQRSGRFFVCT
jgi:hypothetical protein